ncbi:MAG: NUDIX domain-containing protein [Gammaproteobacteria bacterium]|nr:NUDIX domain-containing protein [Gammaproteobacteria bacterium]
MDKPQDFKILEQTLCFDGFFKIIKYRISHTLFAGGWMAPIEREIFERGSAAAVLPYDPDTDQVLLIEQFRAGAIHERHAWLTELIAGIIETGEQPLEVIQREAVEEAGIHLRNPRFIQRYLASPGGSTEAIHLYYAEADLSEAGGFHGLAHEGEDIRVRLYQPQALFDMLENGEISNAMTLIAVYWFREQYRAGRL